MSERPCPVRDCRHKIMGERVMCGVHWAQLPVEMRLQIRVLYSKRQQMLQGPMAEAFDEKYGDAIAAAIDHLNQPK